MSEKRMMFFVINFLVTIMCLGIIVATMFLDNERTKLIATLVAIAILIIQKIVEIIVIKETRKVSIVVLTIIVLAAGYFGYKIL